MSSRGLGFAAFSLCLIGGALNVCRELVALSIANETASHIVAIPFVTLALIYQSRESIFSSIRSAVVAGSIVVLIGLAVLLWASVSPMAGPDVLSIKVAGLVAAWIGGFLLFFGPVAFRAALFPLLFLVFTIPIPGPVLAGATRVLKAGSVEAVAGLFRLSGTPYYRQGFVFTLPSFAIEIADACSGIRSSVAMLLTSLLAGHMFLERSWHKALIVAVILPLTMFKNGIRIVTLSLLAMHRDPGFLTGQLHHEGGIVFFIIGLAMLAPLFVILRRFEAARAARGRVAVA
jgi:exosortase